MTQAELFAPKPPTRRPAGLKSKWELRYAYYVGQQLVRALESCF